jgi:hypothetical protein
MLNIDRQTAFCPRAQAAQQTGYRFVSRHRDWWGRAFSDARRAAANAELDVRST